MYFFGHRNSGGPPSKSSSFILGFFFVITITVSSGLNGGYEDVISLPHFSQLLDNSESSLDEIVDTCTCTSKFNESEGGEPVITNNTLNVSESKQQSNYENEIERITMMERVLFGLPEPDPRLPTLEQRRCMTDEEYGSKLDLIWKSRQKEFSKAMESIDNEGGRVSNYSSILLHANLENSTADLMLALENLEWLVQDIDLALHFIKIQGIDFCTRLIVQHYEATVRQLAAHIVGNAVKNHPKMQENALSTGALNGVIVRLQTISPCDVNDTMECSKMLYAVGSITRGYKPAQDEAIAAGILGTVGSLISNSRLDERLLIKVLALISDFIEEWNAIEAWEHNNSKTKVCDLLLERASMLASIPHSVEPDSAEISPMTKQIAVKLRRTVLSLGCDRTVVDSSSIFLESEV